MAIEKNYSTQFSINVTTPVTSSIDFITANPKIIKSIVVSNVGTGTLSLGLGWSNSATFAGTNYFYNLAAPNTGLPPNSVTTIIDANSQLVSPFRYLNIQTTSSAQPATTQFVINYLEIPTTNALSTNFLALAGTFPTSPTGSTTTLLPIGSASGAAVLKSILVTDIAGANAQYAAGGMGNPYCVFSKTGTINNSSVVLLPSSTPLYVPSNDVAYRVGLAANAAGGPFNLSYYVSYSIDPLGIG